MKTKNFLSLLFIITIMVSSNASGKNNKDNPQKPKKTFVERMPKPIRWIINNWSAKDSTYCIDNLYNWTAQVQDNLSREYLNYRSPESHEIHMASGLSNKIGPYFGYRWLILGATWDLFTKHTKRRNEFTLNINSQLFNIDLIRRRTGGDYKIQKFRIFMGDEKVDLIDYIDDRDMGQWITYDVTGADISMFTNHKKFSNPAGYSNGAIQLRSAGSPIIGIGYTNQHMKFTFFDGEEIADVLPYTKDFFTRHKADFPGVLEKITSNATALTELYKVSAYGSPTLSEEENGYIQTLASYSLTRVPHKININDLHIQLGYAYNFVLSPHLLLSASAIAMPAVKFINTTTPGTIAYQAIKMDPNPDEGYKIMGDALQNYFESIGKGDLLDPNNPMKVNYGPQEISQTRLGIDTKLRAAITYTRDHWIMGAKGQWNENFHNTDQLRFDNTYWNASIYVGYCFGRK